MLNFKVNQQSCTICGECVADCPAGIISLDEGYPSIAPEKEVRCYRCQHCFSVCPTGAISIFGLDPQKSQRLPGTLPESAQLELLIKGRRAVRRYKEENLDPELLQHLLDVACYSPSGLNTRQVRFTIVDDRKKMEKLRNEIMAGLGRLVREGAIPKELDFFADFVRMWEQDGVDTIFRGAPHLLVASAPRNVPAPVEDCVIALSSFEILAQSYGIGTVWDGLAKWVIKDLLPEFRVRLGIPDDHVIGYVMVFGKPAVHYARTAQHGPAKVHIVD